MIVLAALWRVRGGISWQHRLKLPKAAFSIGGKIEPPSPQIFALEAALSGQGTGTLFTLRADQSSSAILATSVNTRRNAWQVWVFEKRNKNCHNRQSVIGGHEAITEKNPRIMLRDPPLSRSDMYT
jgi:hypothetical protein